MRLANARIDPELGIEKQCNICHEWWPLDDEFWYFQVRAAGSTYTIRGKTYTRKSDVRHVYPRCRACWAERSAARHAEKRAGRPDRRYRGNGGARWGTI